MKVRVHPAAWEGTQSVRIPPSKSMAHRAIVCASLAKGRSRIENITYSDDIRATIAGMRQLGAVIETQEDAVLIEGISDPSLAQSMTVDCNESGSTLRFFVPLFTLCGKPMTFVGRNRLMQRPQTVYQELYRGQGLQFDQTDNAIVAAGRLKPGRYEIDGNISSQFISGLLFALPLLDGDSTLVIRPPFESRSYIDLTLEVLEQFGVSAFFSDAHTLQIPGNQTYQANDYTVEGDFSQLAFFAVLGAVHGDLHCTGMRADSQQGDRAILSFLERAGAAVFPEPEGYLIRKSPLISTEMDLSDCPDLGPILMVLAMFAQGETRIFNAGRLRYKESDRIAAMEAELRKFGVDIRTGAEEIWIRGKGHYACEQPLSGHRDHRIVMSMAVAGVCSGTPVVIEGAECIDKSYPAFFEDLRGLGIPVEVLEP